MLSSAALDRRILQQPRAYLSRVLLRRTPASASTPPITTVNTASRRMRSSIAQASDPNLSLYPKSRIDSRIVSQPDRGAERRRSHGDRTVDHAGTNDCRPGGTSFAAELARATFGPFPRSGGFNEVEEHVGAGLCVRRTAGQRTVSAAQDFRGRINGTVTDNTGAVLPGVTVTATSPALIQPQVQVSGAEGDYRFLALPPGVYDLTLRALRVSRASSVKAFASSSTRR